MYLKLGTQLPYLKLGTQSGTAPEVQETLIGSWGLGTQLPYLKLGTILGSYATTSPGSAPAPTTTIYYGSTLIASAHIINDSGVLVQVNPSHLNVI